MIKTWILKLDKGLTKIEFRFNNSVDLMDFMNLALKHVVQSEEIGGKVTATIEILEEE